MFGTRANLSLEPILLHRRFVKPLTLSLSRHYAASYRRRARNEGHYIEGIKSYVSMRDRSNLEYVVNDSFNEIPDTRTILDRNSRVIRVNSPSFLEPLCKVFWPFHARTHTHTHTHSTNLDGPERESETEIRSRRPSSPARVGVSPFGMPEIHP